MTAAPLRVTSRNNYIFPFTFVLVAVHVAVHPSSHSFPMDIIALDWSCGEMCDFLDHVDNKGLRLSSALWVACMRLPYGRITRYPCRVLTLLTQGVSILL